MKKKNKKKISFLKIVLGIILLGGIYSLAVDLIMMGVSSGQIITEDEAAGLGYDCVLVLGCGVRADGSPSDMLADRLDEGISLFSRGAGKVLFLTGDSSSEGYDEISTMLQYSLDSGVPVRDIQCDIYGVSTYDSIYRAANIFGVKKCVIVTQKYHLYRALKIARSLGIEAVGVASDPRVYRGQMYREIREILARNKDFLKCIVKPASVYSESEIKPIQ